MTLRLETKVEIFNTIQLFRPIVIHQWYPACDLSAGMSNFFLDWFAASRFFALARVKCKIKRVIPASRLGLFSCYMSAMVLAPARDSDRSAAC